MAEFSTKPRSAFGFSSPPSTASESSFFSSYSPFFGRMTPFFSLKSPSSFPSASDRRWPSVATMRISPGDGSK